MRIGGLSALGINLASWNAQQAKAAPAERKDVNCILLWIPGGPSQIETWDVELEAPIEVRMNPHSEFIGKDGRPIMALPEGQPIRELV
jgi:hypothetical protein